MAKAKIYSNYQWREFMYRDEVPQSVLDDEFSYHDDDVTDGYFRYKGVWYHLDMFMRGDPTGDGYWDGAHGDSFFSGVVIKLSDDGDAFQVGTYIA